MHPLKKIVILSLLANAGIAISAEQIITPSPVFESVTAGQPLSVKVNYSNTNPANITVAGLGLRIHWDSSKLSFINLSNQLSDGLLGEGLPQTDSSDFDSDPATDTFILVAWAKFQQSWPSAAVTLPIELYTANFTVAANMTEGTTTAVNFSASSTAAGFNFQSTSATKTVSDSLLYVALDTPCRIIDTRQTTFFTDNSNQSYLAWGELSEQGGEDCTLPIQNEQPTAMAANITAISKPFKSSGNLTAYPSAGTLPSTSLINFRNNNIANSSVIALSPDNQKHFNVQAKINNHSSGGTLKTHMVIDAQGYFYPRAALTTTAGLSYIPLTQPCRIVDTRGFSKPFQEFTDNTQAFLAWGTALTLDGQRDEDSSEDMEACLPEDGLKPSAMMANVTVAAKSFKSKGNVVAYQHGATPPTSSLVNFSANNIANAAIISIDSDAAHHFDIKAKILNNNPGGSKQAHVIVDAQGYFYSQDELSTVEKPGLNYIPLNQPCRIIDTRGVNQSFNQTDRKTQGFRAWGTSAELNAQRDQDGSDELGACLPTTGMTPSAMVANITVAAKGFKSKGNISAYPAGGTAPTSSLLNFQANNIANSSIVALNSENALHFNMDAQIFGNDLGGSKQVHVIVDVMGYFYP